MLDPHTPTNRAGITVTAREEIDKFCDAFEAELRSGTNPRLEDYLFSLPDASIREPLFRELLYLDVDYSQRKGRSVSFAKLFVRFPGYESVITEVCGSSASDLWTREPRDAAVPVRSLPLSLDHFELLEVAGRGAWSDVYRARDLKLNRTVAVKMFRPGALESREAEAWLLREARNAGRLSHPGIVPIYDTGQSLSGPYIVMEYVHGPSLAEVVKESGVLECRQAASIVAQVAEAIHYAHERGIVHRDLKPANVILDTGSAPSARESGTSTPDPLAGVPRILDFGLARRLDHASIVYPGIIVGTIAYMSPEQAKGDSAQVDQRSDIYSLGAILAHLVTDQKANSDQGADEVAPPAPPNRKGSAALPAHVPKDLAAVCKTCLETEPALRYPSAQALADDLHNWLDGRPVTVNPDSRLRRTRRWYHRNRAFATVGGALGLALIMACATGFTLWHGWRGEQVQIRNTSLTGLLQVQDSGLEPALGAARDILGRTEHDSVIQWLDEPGLSNREGILLRLALLPWHEEYAPHLAAYVPYAMDVVSQLILEGLRASPGEAGGALREAIARPAVTETDIRDHARALLALLELHDDPQLWFEWGSRPDPRTQTYLIHQAAARGLSVERVVTALRRSDDPGMRYALLLALDYYPPDDDLVGWLREQYRTDLDGGVHAAIGRLLRTWDHDVAPCRPPYGAHWWHNSLGQTMIGLDGFAIAATETTWAELRVVWSDKARELIDICKDECNRERVRDNEPATHISQVDAVEYCRRLSLLEDRTYRLPTVAEWQHACRAGSTTERSMGSMATPWLAQYGWYRQDRGPMRVAALMPNRLGLFDALSNVREWTADTTRRPSARKTVAAYAGGAWFFRPQSLRSSRTSRHSVDIGRQSLGFRVISKGE